MRLIGSIIFLLILACALITFGRLPGLHLDGLGSHDERIGNYQIRLPLGWSIRRFRDPEGDEVPTVDPKNSKQIFLHDWFGGNLIFRISDLESLAREAESYRRAFKRELAFPEVQPGYNATISPITYITIDDILFKKASWSSKGTDVIPPKSRSIIRGPIPTGEVLMGFEFRSMPTVDKEIIDCKGFSLNRTSLNHAEEIVLSLKRK